MIREEEVRRSIVAGARDGCLRDADCWKFWTTSVHKTPTIKEGSMIEVMLDRALVDSRATAPGLGWRLCRQD